MKTAIRVRYYSKYKARKQHDDAKKTKKYYDDLVKMYTKKEE